MAKLHFTFLSDLHMCRETYGVEYFLIPAPKITKLIFKKSS